LSGNVPASLLENVDAELPKQFFCALCDPTGETLGEREREKEKERERERERKRERERTLS
jgi:hypothetical protein